MRNQQISRDDIYNLYALALELDNFVWQIDIFPNLDSIIGLTDIINLFNDLLTLQSEDFQLILAYDTTFQLGDFYVSPLLFRHIYFNGSPIIPLAFLTHDRNFQVSHEKLFTKLSEKIPNLKKKKVPIIIDREKGINNAKKLSPNLGPILCWNHICQDIKHWVRSLDQSSHPVPVFNSTESLIGSVTSSSETLAETSHSLQNVQQLQIALT